VTTDERELAALRAVAEAARQVAKTQRIVVAAQVEGYPGRVVRAQGKRDAALTALDRALVAAGIL